MWYGRGLHRMGEGKGGEVLDGGGGLSNYLLLPGLRDAAVLFAWCLLVLTCSNSHLEKHRKNLNKIA